MMRYLIFLIIIYSVYPGLNLSAQNPDIAWVKKVGGSGEDAANAITTDAAGNVYVTGKFKATVDFDPGPAVHNLSSFGGWDIFIIKVDPSGLFQWAKQMGGTGDDVANAIAIDINGIIYTTGYFSNTVDFDPGPASFNLVANGSNIFVSKLTAAGDFIWAKGMGGTSINGTADEGMSIGVDQNGNVFTCGHFWSANADFDPGPGSFILSSAGNMDLFISKLDPNGNFLWAKRIGGIAGEEGRSLKLDQGGNVITTGLVGTPVVDFDPGPGVFNLTSLNTFILKLDPNGNFLWAKQFLAVPNPNGAGEWGYGIALDLGGNILLTGYFQGQVDFNPGPGTYFLQSVSDGVRSYNETYIVKLDPGGNFIWAKQMARAAPTTFYGMGTAIDVDVNGNVFTVGMFPETTDFDPDAGTYNLTAVAGMDVFLSVLDASGNFVAAKNIVAGASSNWANSVRVDAAGNVYISGNFYFTADFDPCISVNNMTSSGISDGYFMKYSATSVSITSSAVTICPGNPVSFTATSVNGGLSPVYQWQVNGVPVGSNSTNYTTTSLQNGDVVRAILITNPSCTPPVSNASNGITINVVTGPMASASILASATTICQGTSVIFTATPTNGGTSPSYQWQLNGINVGADLPTYTTNSLLQGDIVSVIMTSSLSCVSGSPSTSNAISMSVTNSVSPTVSISSTNPNICTGTAVTFTANSINEGTGPIYQWKLNGNNAGTNSPIFTASSFPNGDIVSVLMTSNANCAVPNSVTSNSIPIVISNPVTPAVSISTPLVAVCAGSIVNFTANPANGGPLPVYQWQVNGLNVGVNSPVYTSSSLVNSDIVSLLMTSNAACATVSVVTSNSIQMSVINETVTPSIAIVASPGIICYGTEVRFTATTVNGGNNSRYQWKLNGTGVGSNSPVYITNTLNDGEVINCILTSSEQCPSPAIVGSNSIVVAMDANTCPQDIYIPTAFTPNRDGKNDILRPVVRGSLIYYEFSIYNRWGQKIFETTDYKRGWDGKVKGIDTNTDTFVWMCTYQFQGKQQTFLKGVVTLIR